MAAASPARRLDAYAERRTSTVRDGRRAPAGAGRDHRHARRSPRRTASTATAPVIGVTVVSLFTVFAASLASSVEAQVGQGFGADLAVNTPAFGGHRLNPAIVDEL